MSDILASAMAAVDGDSLPLSSSVVVLASGAATVLLASALAYVLWMTNKTKQHVAASASAANTAAATSTITIDKTQYPGGEISVYYATQTGTAESFARTLEREGAQYGFYVHVVDLEDVSVEDLLLVQKQKQQQQQQHKDDTDNNNNDASSTTSRVIVLAATYGEGEAPDNATSFARALCEKGNTQLLWERHKDNNDTTNSIPEPVCLQGVDYCVFGLGNKQYDHYNAMGKFFDHALERVGANRILPLGMGDDDDDLENDFETWKDTQLWPTFQKLYNVSQTNVVAVSQQQQQQQQQQKLPECQYVIEYHNNNNNNNKPRKLSMDQVHGSSRHYFTAVQCPVKVVRELRSGNLEAGSTVHMEVDISKHKKQLNYHTADNLGVIPVNNNRVVESVAQSLQFHHHHHNKNDNIDLEQLFSLQAAPNHEWHGAPFPMPISVRDCLAQYCDLTSPPRRSDLKLLAAYATDPTDQKFLLRLASKEGRAEYREKILEQYTGLVQLLQKCPSIQMPLEHFLNLVPLQQTRFYTGSSSSSVHTNTIHLTVAVTQIPRPDGTMFKGVCSTYLANIMQTNSNGETNNKKQQQQMIRVYNRPSTFRLPSDPSTPILMIGPGTGIAPMRALLQERAYQRTKLKLPVGSNILYFGCKKEAHDYLYREELEAWVRDGTLTTLRLAFSRDSPDKKKKVYVQHLLAQDGDTLYKLIEDQGAFIYVCGGVKMGQDVAETLNQIIASHGNLSSHDQAKEYLDKLSASGRFVQELWA